MKKLKNNFTTVKQSKRLLELGVPAWTSDCFYEYSSDNISDVWRYKLFVGENVAIKDNLFSFRNGYTIPCWSVGRLIEILGICAGMEHIDFETLAWAKGEFSEKLIRIIMDLVRYNIIDFSKLEE